MLNPMRSLLLWFSSFQFNGRLITSSSLESFMPNRFRQQFYEQRNNNYQNNRQRSVQFLSFAVFFNFFCQSPKRQNYILAYIRIFYCVQGETTIKYFFILLSSSHFLHLFHKFSLPISLDKKNNILFNNQLELTDLVSVGGVGGLCRGIEEEIRIRNHNSYTLRDKFRENICKLVHQGDKKHLRNKKVK